MSYATIYAATQDDELRDRITAGAMKEAFANPDFGNTNFGRQLQGNSAAAQAFFWPVAIDNEADYEYAVNVKAQNPAAPNPGSSAVISDAAIQAAVQEHWPDQPVTQPGPPD